MITVLIIDDSETARLVIRKALEKSPKLRVVGEAATPEEAMRLIGRFNPDIVTMDVHLGRINGIQLTERIMAESPRPVVIVTGINPTDPDIVYRALKAGALEVVGKLPARSRPEYSEQHRRFVRLIRSLAAVPVVTRQRRRRDNAPKNVSSSAGVTYNSTSSSVCTRAVVIGASTGGPPAIAKLLGLVPRGAPWPIAIVQHIGKGFDRGFTTWLSDVTKHDVVLVDSPQDLLPGRVYVAPSDRHAKLISPSRIIPDADPPMLCVPSADILFESAAEHLGRGAVGVLLTGMGRDGAAGLGALKRAGAMTIAQAPESCVVSGMPKAAIDSGVVERVGSISQIGAILCRLNAGAGVSTLRPS